MTVKAPRCPHQLGRAGNTTHRRTALAPPSFRGPWPSAAGRVTARWRHSADGRLSLEWTLERLHTPFDQSQARKRCLTQTKVEVINPTRSLA